MIELVKLIVQAGAEQVLDALHGKGGGAVRSRTTGYGIVTGATALATKADGWRCARAGGLYDLWHALAQQDAGEVERIAYAVLAAKERADEVALLPAGSKVLVNRELLGTIVEAELMPAPTFNGRPFGRYVVELDGGGIEGFTGEHVTSIEGVIA